MTQVDKQLEVLARGAAELLPEGALATQLKKAHAEGRPLRVKAGFDPTAPDIHLGHTVLLHKLAQFQKFGHTVLLVIGDYTARIGDPSGRSETRPQLTPADIEKNTATYKEQVFKVLDETRTEVVNNGSWLTGMDLAALIELCAKFNVAPMLTRDDFSKRYKAGQPIAIHEFLYPLMQGYDSVELKPDVELGGTDQKFNLLVGRDLMKDYGQTPQSILTVPLLEGTDGVRKMSKSYGNYIGVTDAPGDMYGKIMSISDVLMLRYMELLTDWDLDEMRALHPMEAKKKLAADIVARYHDKAAADGAEAAFVARFSKGQVPDELEQVALVADGTDMWLPALLTAAKLVPSRSEARRRIQSGAVQIDGERVDDPRYCVPVGGPYVVRAGKRAMKRVTISAGASG